MDDIGKLGGYTPVDVHDPGVKEAAYAATEIINKVHHQVQLQKILFAETQVVNGINYHLLLAVVTLPASHVTKYNVQIHKSLKNEYYLTRYHNIPEYIPGGYSPADINDAEVKDAAKFAIETLAKLYNGATLVKITAAATQVVAGLNFYLVLEINIGGQSNKFDVTVFRSLFGSYELTSHHVSHPEPTQVGGFKTITPNDAGVKAAAKAAIEALDKQYKGMTLVRVSSAEVQVVSGINYHLVLDVANGPTALPSKYDIIIYRSLSGEYKLVSYHTLDPVPGGYTNADISDQGVKEAANFAVNTLNVINTGKQKLVLQKIISAEVQIVSGTNYHLILELTVGAITAAKFDVIVYKDLSNKYSLTCHHII